MLKKNTWRQEEADITLRQFWELRQHRNRRCFQNSKGEIQEIQNNFKRIQVLNINGRHEATLPWKQSSASSQQPNHGRGTPRERWGLE